VVLTDIAWLWDQIIRIKNSSRKIWVASAAPAAEERIFRPIKPRLIPSGSVNWEKHDKSPWEPFSGGVSVSKSARKRLKERVMEGGGD